MFNCSSSVDVPDGFLLLGRDGLGSSSRRVLTLLLIIVHLLPFLEVRLELLVTATDELSRGLLDGRVDIRLDGRW